MSRICVNKDERLLMLAHGQLGFFDQLRLRWHIRGCAKCQARYSRYTGLSGALAVVMASPAGPRWLPFGVTKAIVSRGAFLAGMVLLLLVSFVALRSSAEASSPPSAAPALAQPTDCSPAAEVAEVEELVEKKTAGAPTF